MTDTTLDAPPALEPAMVSFADSLRLDADAAGRTLTADPPLLLSNGPLVIEANKGGPNGGYLAALAMKAARDGLSIRPPVRSVSVRYLARPAFAPLTLAPELLRGGRSAAFTRVTASQGGETLFVSDVTFGADSPISAEHRPGAAPEAVPPKALEPLAPLPGVPHFTRLVDYRWAGGGRPYSGGRDAMIRLWMRLNDGAALDEDRLAFLLDAIFPSFYTVLSGPAPAATVDLRYDFTRAITPDVSPDGWVLFEFRTRDWAGGWAVEDGSAWTQDGALIAVARQLRKAVAKSTALA